MNWEKGIPRLWIVLSVAWALAAYFCSAAFDIHVAPKVDLTNPQHVAFLLVPVWVALIALAARWVYRGFFE